MRANLWINCTNMIYNNRICDISRLSCRTLLILTQITVYAILVLVLSRECAYSIHKSPYAKYAKISLII